MAVIHLSEGHLAQLEDFLSSSEQTASLAPDLPCDYISALFGLATAMSMPNSALDWLNTHQEYCSECEP